MPFSPNFLWKNYCFYAHNLLNKRPLVKRRCSHAFTLQMFIKKPALSFSYFAEKTSTLSKVSSSYALFVPIFHLKSLLSSEYCVKNDPFSIKQSTLNATLCQKKSILPKNKVLSGYFFNFFMIIPLLPCLYLIK